MKKRRVGGSGWAGLHGSFVGLGRLARGKIEKKRKKKASKKTDKFRGFLTIEKARRAGLSVFQWRAQSNKLVKEAEERVKKARAALEKPRSDLRLAEQARQAARKASTFPDDEVVEEPRKT
ncbi:hypothetical protein WJT74_05910 [Sphingomicrobium sp. XHP0239]|uniref:hypothetical protein n=1 Tax=Sphingomicrobium maritimum TaxID=3133972 RepID=UPI0031CC6155